MSLVRVLVVDDFSLWQSFVNEHVGQDSNICVVGFASDGLEAVQKAEEFQPDLILLDVSLPKLSGIEAARRIRKCAPKAKILFLSSNSDADVVRGALRAGGHGYVLKWEVGIALLPAMQAVLLGKQFVSIGLMAIEGLTGLQQ